MASMVAIGYGRTIRQVFRPDQCIHNILGFAKFIVACF